MGPVNRPSPAGQMQIYQALSCVPALRCDIEVPLVGGPRRRFYSSVSTRSMLSHTS